MIEFECGQAVAVGICNTSPIQYPHQAAVLWLLPAPYGRVLVPQAVADEIRVGRVGGVDLPDPDALEWLEIPLTAGRIPAGGGKWSIGDSNS